MDGKTICMNYTLSTFAKHTTTKLCCDSKHTTEHVLLLVVEGTIKKNVFSILDSSLSSMALIYPSICLLSSLSITSLSIVQGMEVVSVMVKGLRAGAWRRVRLGVLGLFGSLSKFFKYLL